MTENILIIGFIISVILNIIFYFSIIKYKRIVNSDGYKLNCKIIICKTYDYTFYLEKIGINNWKYLIKDRWNNILISEHGLTCYEDARLEGLNQFNKMK